MLLMATASDHRHCRAAKSSRQPTTTPATTSPSPPAAKSSAGAGLHVFSFSWGTQRRLRCSKNGAPVYASASPSPSLAQHLDTPSPDKEKTKPPQDPMPGRSSRPQRPRNLRPLRYPAAHPALLGSGGAGQALKPPSAPPPPPQARHRKRGFDVALTKREIAEDFAAIRCGRPPRRGKKRKKELQDKIDRLWPGFELAKLDLDNYKIDERLIISASAEKAGVPTSWRGAGDVTRTATAVAAGEDSIDESTLTRRRKGGG